MVKAKHWLCIGAITLALAPAAWADEPNAVASWIEDIVAQIVEEIVGASPAGESLMEDPGPGQDEIGIQVPIGG